MKKFLSFLLVFLFSWVNSYAQSAEIYSTGNLNAKPGETIKLSLSMKNEIKIKAWSFRLVLPDGVTIEKNSRGRYVYECGRMDEHSKDAQDTKDEPLGVQFSVYGNYPFLDNDGTIISLNLLVSETANLGNKEIKLAKINYANMNDQSVYQDDFIIPLKIYNNYSVSATSANEKMGSVTIDPAGDAVENGTSITATATANDGYSFVNWTAGGTEVSTKNPYEFDLAANTALTANFQANKYPVVFKNEGTEDKKYDLDFASEIKAPENPTKEGYTFLGWFADKTKFVEGATVPVNGITYEAKWQINQYTITFNTDGGSEVAAITQDYASAITAPENPTKTGYTFAGWDSEIPTTMPAENKTITATWQINQYTLSFDLNDGDSEAIAEITADYNSDVTKPADPTRTGYTFAGWSPEFTGKVPAGDTTYEAQWTINQYTITFDTDGGSEVEPITQDYESAITAPENPSKTGYTFAGWYPKLPEKMPFNGFNTKAIWTINSHVVIYEVDGVVYSKETLEYGSEINAPANPSKPGWVFIGWESDYTGTTVPDYDVTYKAQWKQDIITMRFVFWDDNKVEYQYKPGEEITEIPEVPAREGYTFKGWDKTIPEVMPEDVENGVLVITANWSVNKYVVYFIANGKTVYKQTMTYGSTIVAPEAPEVEGYTFVGWTPEVAETVPANNVWYEAVYEVNTYTVTYYVDGEVVNVAEVKYGEEIPAYEPTVEEGMKFDGWQEEIPAVMPATNLEIHGTTSGVETAIKNIVAKFGETFDVYNVSGRLVQRVNGASDITRIPAGMYIINGTKVAIRKD